MAAKIKRALERWEVCFLVGGGAGIFLFWT